MKIIALLPHLGAVKMFLAHFCFLQN